MDNEWLKTAIRLAKLGKKQEAQEILHGLVKRDPADFQAWLWLADTMATRDGRVDILREALVHNPNNRVIRQALSSQGVNSVPPAAPGVKRPGEFSISMDDLKSLDQRIDHDEDNAPELDWLRALGESKSKAPEVSTAQKADSKPEAKPKPADLDTRQPEQAIIIPEGRNHADDFLDLIHTRDTTPSPEADLSEQARPARSQDAKRNRSETTEKDKPDAEDGMPLFDGLDYQIKDSSRRRRWLGIIFVLVLMAVLAVVIYMYWPRIWGTISPMISPMITAISQQVVVEPTSTLPPTLSPTPSPTPTNTSTPRPTNTSAPTILPTHTPIPPLVSAGPVGPENIQQFKSLGMVAAHGTVSLNAHLLAETIEEKSIQIWDFETNQPRIRLIGPAQRIQQSAFSPDGKWVAAVSEEPAVWVWDVESGKVIDNLAFSQDWITRYSQNDFPKTQQIQFSPDGKAIFVSSMMGITWWDVTNKQERHLFPLLTKEYEDFRQQALQPGTMTATSLLLSFSPDGKAFAVGSPTKVYIMIWPGAGGRATLATGNPLIAMKWMDNGLLGLIHPGQVSVWNTFLNKQLLTLPGLKSQPTDQPPAAAFQIDGQRMAIEVDSTRNVPGGMRLVNLPGGENGSSFDPLTFARVTDPMFSLDGSILFGSSGGDLFIWDTATGKLLRRVANRKGFIEMSPDGKFYLEATTSGMSIWGIQ